MYLIALLLVVHNGRAIEPDSMSVRTSSSSGSVAGSPVLLVPVNVGVIGMTTFLTLNGTELPVMVDTASTRSSIEDAIVEGLQLPVSSGNSHKVRFLGRLSFSTDTSTRVRLDDSGISLQLYVGRPVSLPSDLVGSLSLGPRSRLGRNPFVLMPSRNSAEGPTMVTDTITISHLCPEPARIALNKTALRNPGLFVVPHGTIKVNKYIHPASMVISSGMMGLDLPLPLYNHLIEGMRGKGLILTQRANEPTITARASACADLSRFPVIEFTLNEPDSFTIRVSPSDYIYKEDGRCVVAVRPVKGRVALGCIVLAKVITVLDARRSEAMFCQLARA
jgi:hypothetical protein